MFTQLIDWLAGMFGSLFGAISNTFTLVLGWFTRYWYFAFLPLLGVTGSIIGAVFVGVWYAYGKVQSLALPSAGGGALVLGDAAAWINSLLPLAEAFAWVLVVVGLEIALLGYRTVKSWIPTLSGS